MDEAPLAEQVCELAHQLWLRGLLVADTGLISVETHRKRYLITRPGRRRADLSPEDLMTIDLGGVAVNSPTSIDLLTWLPHRLAYQRRTPLDGRTGPGGCVGATILANPPMAAAILQRQPQAVGTLNFGPCCTVAVADTADDPAVKAAVESYQSIAIRDLGLLCIAGDLASAVNRLENVEHAATVELARGGA